MLVLPRKGKGGRRSRHLSLHSCRAFRGNTSITAVAGVALHAWVRRDRIRGRPLTRSTAILRFDNLWTKPTRCSRSLFDTEHMHIDAHTPCCIEDQLLLGSPFMKASKRAKAVLASCRSSACHCYHHCPSFLQCWLACSSPLQTSLQQKGSGGRSRTFETCGEPEKHPPR